MNTFLAVALLLTNGVPDQTETAAVRRGLHERSYRFQDAGRESRYVIYVPPEYDPGKPAPLIVALHGLMMPPDHFIRYPGLLSEARKRGCIVVAPVGYVLWGWYGALPAAGALADSRTNRLSEQDVLNVIRETRDRYNIDAARVSLLGHSMGGAGVFHLGMKYPQRWSGLVAIAPATLTNTDGCEKLARLPVRLVHGDQDLMVPVDISRTWVRRMQELKMEVSYEEIAGGRHVRIPESSMRAAVNFLADTRRPADTSGAAATLAEQPDRNARRP